MTEKIPSNADKAIKEIISHRKTTKVLAQVPWSPTLTPEAQRSLINDLLELASSAPYHYKSAERYKRGDLTSTLPFRAYTLNANNCRKLADQLHEVQPPAGKITNMLWAAEAMIVMSWLPDVFGEQPEVREMEPIPFTGNLRNMEHIAAASAAIQNILLGATAAGHASYWSSGGTLRQKEARTLLGIPMDEIFLGCLFVFPEDALERGADVKLGKLRSEGKELSSWSKSIEL